MGRCLCWRHGWPSSSMARSEEHTSELQSRLHLVCRLLLEKKKQHAHAVHKIFYPATIILYRPPLLSVTSHYERPPIHDLAMKPHSHTDVISSPRYPPHRLA